MVDTESSEMANLNIKNEDSVDVEIRVAQKNPRKPF
jgi:hypothetical protein